jgi:hypothetical protein
MQAIWLAQLLGDPLGRDAEAVELRVDSKSAMAPAKNMLFGVCICIKTALWASLSEMKNPFGPTVKPLQNYMSQYQLFKPCRLVEGGTVQEINIFLLFVFSRDCTIVFFLTQ